MCLRRDDADAIIPQRRATTSERSRCTRADGGIATGSRCATPPDTARSARCSTSRPSWAASSTPVAPGTPRRRSREERSTTGARTTSTGSSSSMARRRAGCSAAPTPGCGTTPPRPPLSLWMRSPNGREATFRQSDVCAIRRPKFHIEGTPARSKGTTARCAPTRSSQDRGHVEHVSHHAEAPVDLTVATYDGTMGVRESTVPPAPAPGWGFHRNLADHLLLGQPHRRTARAVPRRGRRARSRPPLRRQRRRADRTRVTTLPTADAIGFGVIGARSMVATRAVMPAIDASERAAPRALSRRSAGQYPNRGPTSAPVSTRT